MPEAEIFAEADRLMTICNSCRYCEGLCAVFPALELRRSFTEGDLGYLANLCHNCGACYDACQFSPPHEFGVNIPGTLARLRAQTYADYAWPPVFSRLYARNGLAVGLAMAFGMAAFLIGFALANQPSVLFAPQLGAGAFYRLMPHELIAWTFSLALLYAIAAMAIGVVRFWRDTGGGRPTVAGLRRAAIDAARLRYLDGGGAGCDADGPAPKDRRKLYHHLTSYGFASCFAATSVGTLYHYLLGREAPYPWWDLPVILGTLGGIGMLVGSAGLLLAKVQGRAELQDPSRRGMDLGFLAILFLASSTGLALLLLRSTPAMGVLMAVHLGLVFSFFLIMPYTNFVHGLYRLAALVRHAEEIPG